MPDRANARQQTHRDWVVGLLEQHESQLLQYASRLSRGNRDVAQDAVQHTYLKLCDQQMEAVGDRMPAWLYRVCRNKVIDELRSQRRHSENSNIPNAATRETEQDPSQLAERSELHRQISDLVDQLPIAQREALLLWAQGFRYREIAEICEKSYVAIRVTIHRAVERLRQSPEIRKQFESTPATETDSRDVKQQLQRSMQSNQEFQT